MCRASRLKSVLGVVIVFGLCSSETVSTSLGQGTHPAVHPTSDEPPLQIRRIIHHFDFAERDDGNLEELPMFWLPFRGRSFPHFAKAKFDEGVGHEAEPSFYLSHNGRNVAYRYAGQAVKVLPNCAYSITAWVRGDRLNDARPAVSAYFLDRDGLPIPGTQRFSPIVEYDTSVQDWQSLRVYLPPGPMQASFVGITLWVVQPEIWDPYPRGEHHIEYRDALGGAWFDDITIHRLPRVELNSDVEGSVFTLPERPHLRLVVSDHDGYGLAAKISVSRSTDPLFHWECPVAVDTSGDQSARRFEIPLDQPGSYTARLDIFAVGSSRVDLQACKLEYSIVSPK